MTSSSRGDRPWLAAVRAARLVSPAVFKPSADMPTLQNKGMDRGGEYKEEFLTTFPTKRSSRNRSARRGGTIALSSGALQTRAGEA